MMMLMMRRMMMRRMRSVEVGALSSKRSLPHALSEGDEADHRSFLTAAQTAAVPWQLPPRARTRSTTPALPPRRKPRVDRARIDREDVGCLKTSTRTEASQ